MDARRLVRDSGIGDSADVLLMSTSPSAKSLEEAKRILQAHREVSPTCALMFTEKAIAEALDRAKAEQREELSHFVENNWPIGPIKLAKAIRSTAKEGK